MLRDGSLAKAYLITLQPLAIGIALCGAAGIGFGIGMGLSRTVEWLSLPVFIILQAAPMAAIIPLITYAEIPSLEFSLAGIPPLFGFWPKLMVFQAAVASGFSHRQAAERFGVSAALFDRAVPERP